MHNQRFAPAQGIYLLNHSVGRLPVTTRSAVERHFFAAWEQGEPDAWGDWMTVFDQFRGELATLLNGREDQFCPQVNLSSGLSKLLMSLPEPGPRNTLLLTENDFPSMGFVMQQAERAGYRVRFMPKSVNPLDIDQWSDFMTGDVCAVLVAHAHYNTGRLTPVAAITALAREREILAIVDISQSAGVVPIDLAIWQTDVVLGSCVKWLCGGPGAGFLWINDEILDHLNPMDVGWFSHQNPFEFNIKHFQYADNASRFWGGTPSVLPYIVATSGIRTLNEIGVGQIRTHNLALTRSIMESVPQSSVVTPLEAENRGGTLVLDFANQAQVSQALKSARVQFDVRSMGMRLSPHIYNTADEINEVIATIRHTI
ncbi:aminotransferase class V-fold PLP-dependent enzyme [Endozoicomonas acroporae]|uniref:aminotransferase class V-fold PLP-dependent enzyme n=1 Tax=Endozoicomonas acroporae TaxID=1701104 RepID=UPI000C785CAE|nr:aminotransferase class V-fold PLP-dependent enzyme [Endozoicomonas acroporae]